MNLFLSSDEAGLGIHNVMYELCNSTNDCIHPPQDIQVESISKHKLYGSKSEYDIGLIRLAHDANTSFATVKPICLMQKILQMTDQELYSVAGWGYTSKLYCYCKNLLIHFLKNFIF